MNSEISAPSNQCSNWAMKSTGHTLFIGDSVEADAGSVQDTLPCHIEMARPVSLRVPLAGPPLVGVRLGDFEIKGLAACGGMGEVYEARDLCLGRKVAIKLLRVPFRLRGPEREYARLLEEARAGAALGDPGFVHVYKFGIWEHEGESRPYLVMEWLPGPSWRKALEREFRPIDLMRWIPRLRDLIAAMARAHKVGVLHRDLKPENILLTEHGKTKIVDLGMACLLGNTPASNTLGDRGIPLAAQSAAGTPEYMAPEVFRCEVAGPQTDVWSLGTILYEVLAGQHPYWKSHRTFDENIEPLMQGSGALSLVALRPGLEPHLGRIVGRALRIAKNERYPNAAVMLEDFDRAISRLKLDRIDRDQTLIDLATSGLQLTLNLLSGRWLSVLRLLLPILALGLTSDDLGLPGLPPIAPQGTVYLAGGLFRMGWDAAEVSRAAESCRLSDADCGRAEAERALSVRWVTLSPFFIDRTEVTNQDFAAWLNMARGWLRIVRRDESVLVLHGDVVLIDIMQPYSGIFRSGDQYVPRPGHEQRPVSKVTWDGALAYCQWHGGLLPTEAQWEYAAGGVGRRRYPWGAAEPRCNDVRLGRNWNGPCGSFVKTPAAVGTSAQDVTPDGIWDLGGNVSEWVSDMFVVPYPGCEPPCRDPRVGKGHGPALGSSGIVRSLRGASYANFPDWAQSAMRSRWGQVEMPQADVGFRCAYPLAR